MADDGDFDFCRWALVGGRRFFVDGRWFLLAGRRCLILGCWSLVLGFGESRNDGVEKIVYATAVLGGDRKDAADAEPMKVIGQADLFVRINFIGRKEQRLSSADEQAGQFEIGGGGFGPGVDDHDHGNRFLKRNFRLPENLRGDEILFFGNNAAGVDDAEVASAPVGLAIEAIASDAGLVANDGAARPDQPVEQRGFSDVRAADDGDKGRNLSLLWSLLIFRWYPGLAPIRQAQGRLRAAFWRRFAAGKLAKLCR